MNVNKYRGAALASGLLVLLCGCGQHPAISASDASSASSAATSAQNQARPAGTVLLDVQADSGKVPTQVGRVVAGKGLESTGAAGQLMFGPYASMAAGNYTVTVFGQFDGAQPAQPLELDASYAQGAKVAKTVKVQPSEATAGQLASFDFSLPQPVSDLEIRARVADGTHVTIKGYKVVVK